MSLTIGLCLIVAWFSGGLARGGLVYDLAGEILSSGDFNGDGTLDVLVLDKVTGNARVGYQSGGGVLTWAGPVATGVENATGVGIGRFLASDRDAVAVTERGLNRVHVIDLSIGTNGVLPKVLTPAGAGTGMLIGMRSPFGVVKSFDYLATWTDHNTHDPGITLVEVFGFLPGFFPQFIMDAHLPRVVERANALTLGTNPVTHASVLLRGTNDAFMAYSPKAGFSAALAISNLPPRSEYVFGEFGGETLPRFVFYVPGKSNLTYATLAASGPGYVVDSVLTLALSAAVERVFYVAGTNGGAAMVHFGDGVRGLTFPGGTPQLSALYASGLGSAGNRFRGVVGLGAGRLALLDGPTGSAGSVHAQVAYFNGTNVTALTTATLPAVTTAATRANVWLFQTEPFVNQQPGFIGSLTVAGWTSGLTGLPGSLQVRVETDGGLSSGLGSAVNTNLGAPPGGAPFGVAEQYRDDISLFAYGAPRPVEPAGVSISPPPGSYTPPLQITMTPRNPGDGVFYRLGAGGNWLPYAGAFSLTADTVVEFFATNPFGQRSRLELASYRLGGNDPGPAPDPVDIDPATTNQPPVIRTNVVMLSENGTVFFGRRSVSPNLQTGLYGPSPYASSSNSPFSGIAGMTYFHLENFEDGALNTPGATASPGWVVTAPGPTTDSVDADDGAINGSGAGGRSFYSGYSTTELTITFDPQALGGHLPTHAGIVWTDVGDATGFYGLSLLNFTARDQNGASLGSIPNMIVGDQSSAALTAEDRFLGVSNPGGISSITLTMPYSFDWEVDHIQYGYLATTGTIWAINLDGSGETFITEGARPRASRDGRYLAFLREGDAFGTGGNLWLRDLWSGMETRLVNNTTRLAGFDWDLANSGVLLDMNCRFWRADVAGGLTPTPLTEVCGQEAPAVNPVDGRVAFHQRVAGAPGIFVTPPDMSSKTILWLTNIVYPSWPSWSPDGDLLTVVNSPGGALLDGGRDLWVVWLGTGANQEFYQITGFQDANSGFPHGALFSPAGDGLVGAGTIFGTNGIWMIPLTADGAECDGPPILLETSPGDPVDFVGSIVVAAGTAGTVRPRLFIALEADAAVVYWSAAYQGFTLEYTTDLGSGIWVPIAGPYGFDGYSFQHREPLASLVEKRSFRLRWP